MMGITSRKVGRGGGGNAAQKMRWVTVLSHDERCQSESVIQHSILLLGAWKPNS